MYTSVPLFDHEMQRSDGFLIFYILVLTQHDEFVFNISTSFSWIDIGQRGLRGWDGVEGGVTRPKSILQVLILKY